MTRAEAWSLYTSHLLSTWNARTYEFAAIIFTASAYPDTLIASSIRGIFNTIAAICFSSYLGQWVDQSPSRFRTLLTTILSNRFAIVLSCVCWYFIDESSSNGNIPTASWPGLFGIPKDFFFLVVVCLGIVEKLSVITNMISMERDWVPILSSPASDPSLPVYDLTHLNAVMRRIDLICQLLAPVVISVIISTTSSVRIGIIVVAATNSLSCGLEWWSLRRVWNEHGRLRQPKASNEQSTGLQDSTAQTSQPLWNLPGSVERTSSNTVTWIQDQAKSVQQYFLSDVWMPSISLSLLHLSVLSYSATFVTYLLSVGFSLNLITVARAIGSIVEISSTLVTPWGVHYLSSTPRNPQNHMAGFVDEEAEEVLLQLDEEQQPRHGPAGLERFGLWGISWQLLNLAPVVLALWQVSPQPSVSGASKAPPSITLLPRVLALTSPLNIQPAETLSLFFFLSASRLGLWIFDLTTQQLTQTRIPPVRRSSFAGTEMSFVSLFELGQWIAAAVFHKPEQFRWLALGSFGAVVVSTALYSFWVWRQRGHLFHWEKIGKSCDCIKGRTN